MKKISSLLFIFTALSCSSFSDISYSTKIEQDENGQTKVYNSKANFQSLTFRDFKFAVDKKEFKKPNQSRPKFKEILFYAKTTDVPYEYYVLYNPEKLTENNMFSYKDTIIENSRFVLAISKNAPASDAKFIKDKISALVK